MGNGIKYQQAIKTIIGKDYPQPIVIMKKLELLH
jgi:hypothetical protein